MGESANHKRFVHLNLAANIYPQLVAKKVINMKRDRDTDFFYNSIILI